MLKEVNIAKMSHRNGVSISENDCGLCENKESSEKTVKL